MHSQMSQGPMVLFLRTAMRSMPEVQRISTALLRMASIERFGGLGKFQNFVWLLISTEFLLLDVIPIYDVKLLN